jgi:hypothetical protein
MKYEFRAVARIVMPMLIILLAAAMLMSATFVLDGRVFHFSDVMDSAAETSSAQDLIAILFVTFEMILGMGLYFLFLAIIIAVSILVIYRFYVSFFTDEGYLTFTLPLTIDQHLWIKLLSMLLWNVLSFVAAGLAIFVILGGAQIGYGGVIDDLPMIFEVYGDMFSMLGAQFGFTGLHAVLGVLYLLASYALQSILTYFAISLGCMVVKKHRLLAAIVSIFIVNMIVSTVSSISTIILMATSYAPTAVYTIVLVISVLLTAAATIATYVGTKYILERKLNLD